MLRSDLQSLVDQYEEMCNAVSTLRALNVEQQQCIELEREQSKKTEVKLKNMICWLTKRENCYKASLDNLEKENKNLRRNLADMKHEYDQVELANNVKVSKLQDEIEFLRVQVTQLGDEYRQQLIERDKQHKDESFKYKHLLEDTTARSLQAQDVTRKSKIGKNKIEKHPALIDEEEEQKIQKFPELEVSKITKKRRKLFQEDNDTAIDIIQRQ
ncbi:uncharacterized protein LOC105182449 isoform X2 [Harpegnathos saltator]|uniref:uncharacterized protein LOC105182449 isoform X2 n=1 Tax=Harpegnathos saltator TaxID=610380 RepID=UPI000DBEE311|nr:uncharacterized protein LOC105182449 isoform X2 [Harpegnathos saltator]